MSTRYQVQSKKNLKDLDEELLTFNSLQVLISKTLSLQKARIDLVFGPLKILFHQW